MNNIFEYEGYKFNKGSVTKVTDPLTVEAPLQININGESFTVVMQTPGDEIELATGLLFAENVIKDFNEVKFNTTINKRNIIDNINLETPKSNLDTGYLSSRSLLSVSSCGICGKKEIADLKPKADGLKEKLTISFTELFELHGNMFSNQDGFQKTGGCHGVAAFDENKKMLALKEDIGRHNALDKVVGKLIAENKLDAAKFITFSGRISYEIVSKAFRAKIPVIAAVSSPSSLAIDFGKEFGLTLVGFCRENKATCYSFPNRITELN
ncbi:MAG: FdhD protein [Arenicella sp.]|jgi:FdhD protein